jgi:hypothetical protein
MENLSYPDEELRLRIRELNPEAQFLDGCDEAIIGVVETFGRLPVVCYDKRLLVDILIENGEDGRESVEHILSNFDENAPIVLTRMVMND